MGNLKRSFLAVPIGIFLAWTTTFAAGGKISEDTETCIGCHEALNPGIVADWKRGRMSRVTPAEAAGRPAKERRVSFDRVPEPVGNAVVGCAECHTLDPERHRDSFDHNGYSVHVVVTPEDCASCHPAERKQYGENLMANAYGNLRNNPVYSGLADAVNGIQSFEDSRTLLRAPDAETEADSCFYCHGTVVEVRGTETRETAEGEMTFPVLSGWPNQGVGRINPDGSKGSCTACHTRHRFSIEMARRPSTCSECHKGPDVPGFKVYEVSKHGNIFSSLGKDWDYEAVPWKAGADFTAPTCATCHASLIVNGEGEVIAERTHRMNDRLAWRLFGLIYAHPHPKSPDTTVIRNKAGLPLPTELTGEPASEYLIDAGEQGNRRERMKKGCLSCHSRSWVDGQFARYENTIRTSNEMTLASTRVLLRAWEKGAAAGLSQKDGIFNEAIEKKWVAQWLFYANSTRYASAMMGADYGVFADGRWAMSRNIQEMLDWLEFTLQGKR
ncbi:MAG: cytochrome c3 family protein [Deltaproteobacteria bacterium]|nr:cytochrome c3 family protein [Deltaproteobacteria bacterium]